MTRKGFTVSPLSGEIREVEGLKETHKAVGKTDETAGMVQIEKIDDRWHIVNIVGANPECLGSFSHSSDAIEFTRLLDLLIDRGLLFPRWQVAAVLKDCEKLTRQITELIDGWIPFSDGTINSQAD